MTTTEDGPRSTPAAPFVGRAAELEVLRARLALAAEGITQTVVVTGPRGIGVTALLDRFVEECASGALGTVEVRRVTADRSEATLPFGVVDQLGVPTAGGSSDPLVRGAGLVEELGSADATVAVVLDDAHWADPPSLLALTFALRRLGRARVLLVVSHVESSTLSEGLIRLARGGSGARLRLEGLSAPEIRRLTADVGGGAVSDRVVERLSALTDGHPLALVLLVDELSRAELHDPRGMTPDLPATFEALASRRLAEVDDEARRFLDALVVVGDPADLAVVAPVAEVDDGFGVVDRCRAAGLVTCRDHPAGWRVTVAHPAIRLALLGGLSSGDRARIHLRAAATAVRDDVALGHRLAAVDGHDDDLAAAALAQAERAETLGAWASAADWSLRASRVCSSPTARDDALLSSVSALIVAGDLPAAAVLLATVPEHPPGARAEFLRGRLACLTGRLDEGERRLLGAWATCGPGDEALAGMVASHLAALGVGRCRGDEAVDWASRAVEAQRAGAGIGRFDIDPVSRLLLAMAIAGRVEDGAAFVAAHPELVVEDGSSVDGRFGRGLVRSLTGDLAGASADLAEVAGWARAHGPFHLWTFAESWRSAVAYRSGHWDDAVRHALDATTAADTESWSFAAAGWSALAVPLASRGQLDAAREALAAGRTAAGRAGDPALAVAGLDAAEAWTCLVAGDPARAVALVEPWLSSPIASTACLAGPSMVRLAVSAWLRLGLVDRASAALDAAPEPGASLDATWRGALVAEIAAARGELDDADSGLATAIDAVDDAAVFDRAELVLSRASVLRRLGRRRGSADLYAAAREVFASLDAVPFVDRCDEGLAMAGLTPRRRGPGPEVLTPTEQVVAGLATRGLTNKEIAAELVVSVKTVEFHLGNVYRKLAVANRAQLVAHVLGTAGS